MSGVKRWMSAEILPNRECCGVVLEGLKGHEVFGENVKSKTNKFVGRLPVS